MGACVKMFVVANCLGDVMEAGIQEMCFLTATLFSILKIISEHTSYLSHQYNTVVYQHSLNKDICIHSVCRIRAGRFLGIIVIPRYCNETISVSRRFR